MIELYSIKETAKIFAMSPSRLRYWTQTGFVAPTVRRNGRLFYTFRDLVNVKTAKELLAATGKTMDEARSSIDDFRDRLPAKLDPSAPLSICSDGDKIHVVEDDTPSLGDARDVLVAFRLSSLASRIAEVLKRPVSAKPTAPPDEQPTHKHKEADDQVEKPRLELVSTAPSAQPKDGVPSAAMSEQTTESNEPPSAYECFLSGFAAEKRNEQDTAAAWYMRTLHLEPSMAAALTNLGNIHYKSSDLQAARESYEQALEHEPEQAAARYNLGNILDELGETELSIAQLRQVVSRHPSFADAHYNLGLILFRVGGTQQARAHLHRYLELDSDSQWADRAKSFLEATKE